ncbi:MAG: exo-alpha-sialidase [Verrucomicrobiae bacterium]|nr:exo-alpha-sialidase [Verrucomicrobiae bacterium]MCP5550353.1 exo-alpha-sialidase [Akkermansiaceae bacterium]
MKLKSSLPLLLARGLLGWAAFSGVGRGGEPVDFRVQLDVVRSGFDKKTCWVHARAGAIPFGEAGKPPTVVMTMQKLLLTGSDVFYALNEVSTADDGKSWSEPVEHTGTLGRREEADGVEVGLCDFTPKWHARTGRLLGIGHTVRYRDNAVMKVRPRETAWSVYDPASKTWSAWRPLKMPDEPRFQNAGAGSVQRVDLPDGDVLVPVYCKRPEDKAYGTVVLRCGFDGSELVFKEYGDELKVEIDRGLYEPSLTRFGGRFFLTMRNDRAGYVAAGGDGLHFSEPKIWTFDDGAELGNYNTQQHWVTHRDGLFLVYTRKGAENDHVFRHRAPLFIARVDPVRLCVLRATERVLVPEKGARLGNFGVTEISPGETWVTVTEWMQTTGPDPHDFTIPMKHGADNRVYAARIFWSKPDADFGGR